MGGKRSGGNIQSTGSFLFCLLISLVLNLEGLIPAVIALVLYLLFKFPPLWVVYTMAGIWILVIIVQLLVIRWAASKPPRQTGSNKNPYSSTGYVPGSNKNPYSATGYLTNNNKQEEE